MEELVKVNKDEINIDNKESINDFYLFKVDGKKVGYGFTTNISDDMIKIYIDEEYRSNGYGKILFGKMLELFDCDVKLKTSNKHMYNIICSYGGKLAYNAGDLSMFIILKNK